MMLRSRETGKMPMNLQFFAEGSGEGGEGNGNQNNNAGNGNSNQNTGNNNQGATYTQEQLDGIVNSRTARAEQSALRSFFQQQGMSENEVTQAINSYKEQRAKNKPDVAGMQTQLAQEQSRNLQLTIENSATLQAVELGIDSKSIPYVIKMADFDDNLEAMTEASVPLDRVILYCTPAYYKLLKNAEGIQRTLEVSGASTYFKWY